jgi:alkyl sulfatase BDS1-like metallo-beta-lactamase superfamily hydrolase
MGWYDANPVNLAPLEPADASKRYVEAMGGRAAVAARAEAAFAAGDDRWAGELGRHLVYADSSDSAAKALLAKVLERQAKGAESAIGRNMYLAGAQELRQGVAQGGGQTASLDVVRNTPTPMFLDLLAVRLDPSKSKGQTLSVDLNFTDRNERYRVTIRNDVLIHEANPAPGTVDASYTLPRAAFLSGALAGADLSGSATAGDRAALGRLLSWMTAPRQGFAIMTR